jgi:enoyl-CoA hydratase/carnithine racemase
MRPATLEALGLGSVLDIFRRGTLPVDVESAVERVFGPASDRGALVISGGNGIVGAGKTMQLGSRLEPYGVRVITLDFPGAADGIGRQYPGLVQAFGREAADRIMSGIVRLTYDGRTLPSDLAAMKPRFLLEAIPEILEAKKSHYHLFREAFPEIEIRSVTSGFPSSELGVGIAHPAFPHEINKVYEVVEQTPSDFTRLLWALGLIPVAVSDHWSFVLDVLFCGVTLAGLRHHRRTNMPFWKIDKLTRRLLGPNPFRAHDAIGSKGADFLTWSCLHHLSEVYGDLFRPTPELIERKDTGQAWYPPDHLRPVVDWTLTEAEAQGIPRRAPGTVVPDDRPAAPRAPRGTGGPERDRQSCAPSSERSLDDACAWAHGGAIHGRGLPPRSPGGGRRRRHPKTLERMDGPDWEQLYVNAEHDGTVGVVTLSRESYSWDVDRELNRALDWLEKEKIRRVILTGDFHLSTQMVGADTADFFSALDDVEKGLAITRGWPATARRFHDQFEVSVGFVPGKRLLGGMLELLMHCHHLVAVEDARLGWPEVTLPVVPGMEGCHWPFRRAPREQWGRLARMLLTGETVRARDAVGWLADHAAPMDEALKRAWALVGGEARGATRRPLEAGPLEGVTTHMAGLPEPSSTSERDVRTAFLACIDASCRATAAEALELQARHAAEFLASPACRTGRVGAERARVMTV